jgi:hypothetical protein
MSDSIAMAEMNTANDARLKAHYVARYEGIFSYLKAAHDKQDCSVPGYKELGDALLSLSNLIRDLKAA